MTISFILLNRLLDLSTGRNFFQWNPVTVNLVHVVIVFVQESLAVIVKEQTNTLVQELFNELRHLLGLDSVTDHLDIFRIRLFREIVRIVLTGEVNGRGWHFVNSKAHLVYRIVSVVFVAHEQVVKLCHVSLITGVFFAFLGFAGQTWTDVRILLGIPVRFRKFEVKTIGVTHDWLVSKTGEMTNHQPQTHTAGTSRSLSTNN